MRMPSLAALLGLAFCSLQALPAAAETYAERLGWKPGDRVVMFHVDDAGMSHDSNVGALRSVREGVATSISVMMPCPWVPELVAGLHETPGIDAGLHLTLTSEWEVYCWGPLVGKEAAPGLVDPRGCLWPDVASVVRHATPDEVESEIRAQIRRARELGFEPTHLDSHMGTLFATPELLERYIEVGAGERIPIMFPGGHRTALRAQYMAEQGAVPERFTQAGEIGERIWEAGLPVLDDLHNTSYGWRPDAGAQTLAHPAAEVAARAAATAGTEAPREAWREIKVERYAAALREMEPGVTMIILHATETSETFPFISNSGPTRQGDLDAMLDARLRTVIEQEGILLTTWRELMERRRNAQPPPPAER
ncbi:MAG TPA: polysaccharide deacetylase family protein [Thermoanaerobaculia bacterium]|nr:polysaccharide deacetylase family protein [Thermoanaerobaculia bacterium]